MEKRVKLYSAKTFNLDLSKIHYWIELIYNLHLILRIHLSSSHVNQIHKLYASGQTATLTYPLYLGQAETSCLSLTSVCLLCLREKPELCSTQKRKISNLVKIVVSDKLPDNMNQPLFCKILLVHRQFHKQISNS